MSQRATVAATRRSSPWSTTRARRSVAGGGDSPSEAIHQGQQIAIRHSRGRLDHTSLAFEDIESLWIRGGGGSWDYEAVAGGTRRAVARAKAIIEAGG